jgi:sugar porter (SP) family MFS transporter
MTSPRARGTGKFFFFGALAEVLFGYDTGIAGVALLSIKKEFTLTPALSGFVISCLLLGAAVGGTITGRVSDRIGRKPTLFLITGFFFVGGLLGALAPNVWVLIIARVIMGFGVGGSAAGVSVYLVEVAPSKRRGGIGALGQMMVVTGAFTAYIVGYFLQPADAWRWMIGLSIVPAAVLLIGLNFLPESPRWYMAKGRDEDARRTLERLQVADIDAEMDELRAARDAGAKVIRSVPQVIRAMFSTGARRAAVAAMILAVVAQFIGTNTVTYYTPTALTDAGLSTHAAVAANLSVGVVKILFTGLSILFVLDRLPRRTVLTTGLIGIIGGMAFLTILNLVDHNQHSVKGWLTLLGLLVFEAGFEFAWGPLVRVVLSELFPSSVRGTATGLVLILNWLANFTVAQAFPSVLAYSAALSFGIFTVVAVFALVFVRFILPETGGQSLEKVAPALSMQLQQPMS